MAKEKSKQVEKKVEKVKETVAVVMNGNLEVRRYTLEVHGENFEALANEFASKGNYIVRLEVAKIGIKCPSCGHVFSPSK